MLNKIIQMDFARARHRKTVFGPYIDDYLSELIRRGLDRLTIQEKLYVVTRFGEYLSHRQVRTVTMITMELVSAFLDAERRVKGASKAHRLKMRWIISALLRYLQNRHAISLKVDLKVTGPLADIIKTDFARRRHTRTLFGPYLNDYLGALAQKKLASRTIRDNLFVVTRFGEYLGRRRVEAIDEITSAHVDLFLKAELRRKNVHRIHLLRYNIHWSISFLLQHFQERGLLRLEAKPGVIGPLNSLFSIDRATERHRGTFFGPYIDDYVSEFTNQGFRPAVICRNLFAITRFGEYLGHCRLHSIDEIRASDLERFLRADRKRLRSNQKKRIESTNRWIISRFLRYLEKRGVLSLESPSRPAGPLGDFCQVLIDKRGLNPSTVEGYQHHLNHFLRYVKSDGSAKSLSTLTGKDVDNFLIATGHKYARRSMAVLCPALRGFLQHLYQAGILLQDLSRRVLMPKLYALERIPCALPWDTVQSLFEVVDRTTPQGKRDLAILWLLVTYGVRPGEIVKLRLDDIDWRNDTICFRRSKAGRDLHFPLTQEAGEAIIEYLRDGRPKTSVREIFIRINAPFIALSRGSVVSHLLRGYLQKAEIKTQHMGAGVIRHSFAVHLLRQGHPMKTITDMLGHQNPTIVYHYTKLAVEDLHGIDLPVAEVLP